MNYGFIRVAAATPFIKVADCQYNSKEIIKEIQKATNNGAKLVVLPELSITGSTCGDLFFQNDLVYKARVALEYIIEETRTFDILGLIGLPFEFEGKLFNAAAIIHKGRLLAIIPKRYLNHLNNENRYFDKPMISNKLFKYKDYDCYFGKDILIKVENMEGLIIGIEFSNELMMPLSPSFEHCNASASIIANLSSLESLVGRNVRLGQKIKEQSDKLTCGYIYAEAGEGESTTDKVFTGYNIIAENGKLINSKEDSNILYTELDIELIINERRRKKYFNEYDNKEYKMIDFRFDSIYNQELFRKMNRNPFILKDEKELADRCDEIINLQCLGLKKRLSHINARNVVIGISGGLDSTIALLIVHKTFKMLNLDNSGIHTITMPCYGTTNRTYNNSIKLSKALDTNFREIPIKDAVDIHFRDIGQNKNQHDITYENAQARERTQVLMDIANMVNGIVIGTGDMSELALGWATYNGDHMSMYAVNSSVPKTLVKYLVQHIANESDGELREVLLDILDTPVSPELLPPVDGEIGQKTEEIVGPYELHDFFMYYVLRHGFTIAKIYYLAKQAFKDIYSDEFIERWIRVFYTRFISQQYKRSCLPDGPKVGSINLSPRGGLLMPSDASSQIWMKEIENIKFY